MTEALVPQADKKAFVQCFNRLMKAKRAKDVDAADMQIYYNALSRYPLWAIEEAADELQRKHTFGFPTTDVWVQQCEAEQARRLRESLARGREWKEECSTCHDSGWVEHFCTNMKRCGRRYCTTLGEKHEHEYYSPCSCRPTNHTYQRNTRGSSIGHGSQDPS